jgi:DNA polymerase (family 10)
LVFAAIKITIIISMKINITKKELLNTLEEIADLLEFTGANQFKVRAYRNAVNALRYVGDNFEESIVSGELLKVKGIGKGIFATIKEFWEEGYSRELNELKKEVPKGIEDLLHIRGLGIKKLILLSSELNIESIDDLEEAVNSGNLSKIKGFGDKSADKIKAEIERIKTTKHLLFLDEAFEIAEALTENLLELPSVIRVELTGELRRIREVISRIDLLVLINREFNSEILSEIFSPESFAIVKVETDNAILQIIREDEKKVFLNVVASELAFNRQNFILTGSHEFVEDFKIPENGISSEKDLFEKNNRKFIPVEMRESEFSSIFNKSDVASNLDFPGMKGMLHFHTIYSDGVNTLEEMVKTGLRFGMEYFAVCDHSKSAYYANGLQPERLILQKEEIDVVKSKLGVPLFHGIESDILINGDLDYPDEILKEFDFIVASVHSNFTLDEEAMTRRIIKAVESPYTNALGHPTGRILLRRDGYKLNIKKVIDACAANNVAIEINANPRRLDLDWRNYNYAREKGVKFTINADAHATSHIEYTKYGVMVARKGGIKKEEVINYFPVDKFLIFCNK